MLRFRLCILGLGLLSSAMSLGAQADQPTVVEKYVVVSPAPKATCTTISAHWEGNVWIDKQEICKYEGRPEGITWVNSYWSCTTSTADGNCTNWTLVPGYWKKTE